MYCCVLLREGVKTPKSRTPGERTKSISLSLCLSVVSQKKRQSSFAIWHLLFAGVLCFKSPFRHKVQTQNSQPSHSMFKFLKKHLAAPTRPTRLSILDFAKPETFPRMQTTSDSSLGGFSTAYFEPYRASADSDLIAHFHGNLNQTLPKGETKVRSSGWAMFKTKNRIQDPNAQFKPFYLFKSQANFWWDWTPFEVLHLRVMNLTPGRKFMVNVQTDTMSRTDLYQHRLFTNSSDNAAAEKSSTPVWENIFINLNEFVLTNRRHRTSSISI